MSDSETDQCHRALITLREAAQEFHISGKTLRNHIRRGELSCYRLRPRGRILMRRSEIDAWLELHRHWIEKDADARGILETPFARPKPGRKE